MPKFELRRPGTRTWIHVVVLVVATAIVFSNTLNNDYHLDSIYRVKDNTELDRVWPPWRFFTDSRTGSTIPQIVEYRPMMPLSHAVNAAVSDYLGIGRLAGFHLGNIAIHIATTILLYLLFGELLAGRAGSEPPRERLLDIAFVAALMFAVHPVSGVPVNYIAGRDLLLMMAFLTAALLVYARMRRRGDTIAGWCAVLTLLAFSLMSKTNSAVAFALVLSFEFFVVGAATADWRPWARSGAVAVLGGVFAWINFVAGGSAEWLRSLDLSRALDYPLVQLKLHLLYYPKNVVWPFQMRPLPRVEPVGSIFDAAALAGAVFILATLVLAWWLRKRSPIATFSILAYWLLFAVTSSVIPINILATDYRQYPSLAFLCLLLAIAVFAVPRQPVRTGAAAALVVYFAASSFGMNTVWRTEESFWGQSVRHGGTALAHTNYAFSVAAKDPALAERHYLEAIRRYPSHVYANINLGLHYIRRKRGAEGLALLRRVVALNPDWANTHYWLAVGLTRSGLRPEALTEYRRAADLDPRGLRYQHAAARALQTAGEIGASIGYLERLRASDPNFRDASFLLGFAHQSAGRGELAIELYRRFLMRRPRHVQARFNLAHALMKAGDCERAVGHFERVLSLRPGYHAAHLHLSSCYRKLGDGAKADEHATAYRRRPRS